MSEIHPAEVVFFFNDPATTEIYTLSLHDALPILAAADRPRHRSVGGEGRAARGGTRPRALGVVRARGRRVSRAGAPRSEEHTSALQSQSNLVCRLLLGHKKPSEPEQVADLFECGM